MLDGQEIAVTAGCMNRLTPLARSASSWLSLPEVDHVAVVDWSSDPPLRPLLDPRILVVRVSGQQFWRNSLCHNLEIETARSLGCHLLLRLDADVVVRSDFFKRHRLDNASFYAVDCHKVPVQVDHKRSLCGTVLARVDHILRANGYNERLRQYGYEDEDLFHRLAASGLDWKLYDLDTLDHIPHTDEERLEHLDIRGTPPDVVRAGPAKIVHHCVYQSLDLARSVPWGPSDRRTRWTFTRHSTNYWEASPCS